MTKNVLYTYLFLWGLLLSFVPVPAGLAQPEEKLLWEQTPQGIRILEKTPDHIILNIHISGVSLRAVSNKHGNFFRIVRTELTSSYHEGYPDLPVLRKLIEIPAGAKALVEKVSWKTYHIPLEKQEGGRKLFPAQRSVMKRPDGPPPVFKMNRSVYSGNEFVRDSLVRISTAGMLRGHELAYLTISPFGYNPVNNILDVKDDIILTIRFTRPFDASDRYKSKSLYSPVFHQTFEKILATETTETKGISSVPVKYVILTDSMFRYCLKDFIRWKTQQGYRVMVVYKGSPGVGTTADSIKAYLKSLYDAATPDDPAPTFLLIVGDTGQIPSSSSGQTTDLFYATYDGPDDYIPDIYYGRFSARDSGELMPQLNKTLEYEQYLFPDPSFLNEAVMVAGVDGSFASVWGNGQINYATENYVNTSHGYDSHTYLYPASGSSDNQIIRDISNGASLVNYTGHGRPDRWEDPTFTTEDIATLENAHKYPLVITNGCSTGAFGNPECFAEAMMRAAGKGAMGYIGCTNDSYWDEDYYWAVGVGPIVAHPSYEETSLAMYDRLFHDHGESRDDWYVSQDQMIFAGNLAVMQGNPSKANYYWEIYHLFGDPSLMVYLSEPEPLTLLVPETIPLGLSSLSVIAEPGTYIGLTYHDTLLDAVTADLSGNAVLHFPPLKDTGNLLITGTRQNRIPVIDTIMVIGNSDPWLQVQEVTLDDSASDANGLADNGDTFYLDVLVKNEGGNGAGHLTAILSGYSNLVDILDTLMQFDTLMPGRDTLIRHAFRIHVEDSVPDQQMTAFRVKLTDNASHQWNSYFSIMLYAPVLKTGRLTVDDKKKGNGNSRLEPGEPVLFSLQVFNRGHGVAHNVWVHLALTDSLVNHYQDSVFAGTIDTMDVATVPFTATIDSSAPYGSTLLIETMAHDGPYMAADTFTMPVGLTYEDFESGNFEGFPWHNDSVHPWVITGEDAWHGMFSAVSGAISDNEQSSLSIQMETPQDDSVSFYYRVSSEKDWDILKFYIDGVDMNPGDSVKDKWSGELPWRYASFPVDSGSHTLAWRYIKDSNTSKGLDRAWIDYIVFPRFSFSNINAGVSGIVFPKSGPDLGGDEPLTIVVKNYGSDDLSRIPLLYRLNNNPPVRDTLTSLLASGDTAHFTFATRLDLSVLKTYHLFVTTKLDNDQVPINDGLATDIIHEGTVDIVLDSLVSPSVDSAYGAFEHIGVQLINASSGAVDSFPLHYRINDAQVVTQAFDTVVHAGDTARFYFSRQENMADTGNYLIIVYVTVPGDAVVSNDTLIASLYNKIQEKKDIRNISAVTVWPNPVRDFLFVRLSSPKLRQPLDMAVMDMNGRVVLQRQQVISSGNQTAGISVSSLSPGTYLLLLYNDREKIAVPFVKK